MFNRYTVTAVLGDRVIGWYGSHWRRRKAEAHAQLLNAVTEQLGLDTLLNRWEVRKLQELREEEQSDIKNLSE